MRFVAAVLLMWAVLITPVRAGWGDDDERPPPPVFLANSRSVTTRDAAGGVQRLTSIPASSAFARHGGGPAATCTVTADRDDFRISTGERVPAGTVVTSGYLFVEGAAAPFDLPPQTLPPDVLGVASKGPLQDGRRTFSVFCDDTRYDVNFRGFIDVVLTDPLFDPRSRIDDLRNRLQLLRPVVVPNPVVDTYGGLVVRYPSWLAIRPDAWATQRSNTQRYRGATLALVAQPRELEFVVSFTPNPDRPSPAFTGVVSCVPAVAASSDGAAVPAFPELPDMAEPGVNGPCQWTPPGPGSVTVTARIVYTLTFWVSGYTERLEDYVWTSEPTTFLTGELRAVNTNPNRPDT